MRQAEILVVDHNKKSMFQIGTTLFECLFADVFEGGQLVITRDGKELDRTEQIRVYGTHAACVCFCGLKNVFGDGKSTLFYSGGCPTAGLIANDLQVGDRITLNAPRTDIDDLEEAFTSEFRLSLAHQTVYAATPELSDAEYEDAVNKEVERSKASGMPVIFYQS